MPQPRVKTAHLLNRHVRDDFVAVLVQLAPAGERYGEALGLYLLVCAFWGLVVYAAVAFALP